MNLYDRQAAADYCGFKTTTLENYRRSNGAGRFPDPASYIGNKPVWTRAQLDHFLDNRPGSVGRPANEDAA